MSVERRHQAELRRAHRGRRLATTTAGVENAVSRSACYGRRAGAASRSISHRPSGPVWTSRTRVRREARTSSPDRRRRGQRADNRGRAGVPMQWSAALRAGAAARDRRSDSVREPAGRGVASAALRSGRAGATALRACDSLYVRWPRQQAPYVIVVDEALTVGRSRAPCLAILRAARPEAADGRRSHRMGLRRLLPRGSATARARPFLVVFNHWRGPHGGGGQWATERRPLPVRTRVAAPARSPSRRGSGRPARRGAAPAASRRAG